MTRRRQKVSQKHSQKMGAGGDFYRSEVSPRVQGHDERHGPWSARRDRNACVRSRLSAVRRCAPSGRAAVFAARPGGK